MKGLINIKNKDLKCFMWCHIRLVNPTDSHPERINKQDKKIASSLDYSGIDFPMKIHDYELVEERFEMNVNVFCYENKVYPIYISKRSNTQLLNVLLITSEEISHYVFIEDFDRLMYSKAKAKNQHKKFFCMACLQNFTTEEILSNHKKQCFLINGCQVINYESGQIKFTNYEKQVPIPFKIYADTKFFLKRTNSYECEHKNIKNNKISRTFSNSIGAKLVCIDDRFTLPVITFKGKNCINKFIWWVINQNKRIKEIITNHFNKELIMTTQDEEIYNNSQICWICNEELNTDKVRDHCHITGKFRGAAHNQCNLKLKIPKKLFIIFHSLEGYDEHIIFKELNNFDVGIGVIPKTIEKYMSIIVNRTITFIDSNEFYKGALDTLASNLEDNYFKYLMSEFPLDKLEILKRKDAYPYEWVNSYEKFNYPQLPPKECFYSPLRDGKKNRSDGHISNEQYQDLKNVWDIFNFNTFEDFHNHYLKKDALLLADVFEKSISTSLKYHN